MTLGELYFNCPLPVLFRADFPSFAPMCLFSLPPHVSYLNSLSFSFPAMVVQVCSLMPLRTCMNYQYRYGMSMTSALKTLYADGGIRRYYRGISAALVQAPLSRFGDTASNAFALALLENVDIPVAVKTIGASVTAGAFRILLVPVDTLKTAMQVEGKNGVTMLKTKVAKYGTSSLFHGALASAAATFVGHYPWFATFNTLQEIVPKREDALGKLARNAGIGFVSAVVSDTCSNSIRVIKTYRQTAAVPVSYPNAVKNIIATDGISGLLWRGLRVRILANGLQGILFSVVWRYLEEKINKNN